MSNIEITGELIKTAVAKKILSTIPSAIGKVYKESQHQNVVGDAFYITQRRINQTNEIKTIVKRDYEITVRYEADIKSENPLELCAEMGNILMMELKSIDSGNGVLIHGQNMDCNVVDNVALISVTYTIRIKQDLGNYNPMQDLRISKEVK